MKSLQFLKMPSLCGMSMEDIADITWNGLRSAVKIAVRGDEDFAVFLSGGLDTGLIAAACCDEGYRPTAFTVKFDKPSRDHKNCLRTAEMLNLPLHTIRADESLCGTVRAPLEEILGEPPMLGAEQVYLAYKALRDQGKDTVLGGHGGDELFGGYPWHYNPLPEDDVQAKMDLLFCTNLAPLLYTEERIATHFGIRLECPFLNPLVAYTSTMPPWMKYERNDGKTTNTGGKLILRKVAAGKLPKEVVDMPKQGFTTPWHMQQRTRV